MHLPAPPPGDAMELPGTSGPTVDVTEEPAEGVGSLNVQLWK